MIRAADVARHLSADPSLVARWVARGMPLDSLGSALAWHAASIRPRQRTRATQAPPPPSRASMQDSPAAEPAPSMTQRLLAARTLREESDASAAALKLAELRGELVRVAAVESALARHCVTAKEIALGAAARLAPILAGESDPAKAHALLDGEMRRLLHELAEI